MPGDQQTDDSSEAVGKTVDPPFMSLRQVVADHINADVAAVAGGNHRPQQTNPEHQNAQGGIGPDKTAIEEVAQKYLCT